MLLDTLSEALISSIYHLIIFLITWDDFDFDAQNEIAGIENKNIKIDHSWFLLKYFWNHKA